MRCEISMIDFKDNIILIYGEKGKDWLENLQNLQKILAEQWGLRDLSPCKDLSYNYVVSGWQDKSPIILKIGCNLLEVQQEYDSIRAFNGHGLIELLNADLDKGAILITRAIPGNTLTTLFPDMDDKALGIACGLVMLLHKATTPAMHKFPLLSEWLSIIDKEWDIPKEQLQLARNLKNDLLRNSQTDVLLHGDVHYANILSNGDDWVVIDPKGVIGDPLYDITGALLREPFKQMMALPDIPGMLQHRILFVAQYCNVSVQQIWAWTFVQTVMSICWSLEDGQDVSLKRKFLDILKTLCY